MTCHLRTLSPLSGWQAARVLPGGEKSIDLWKDSETVSQQRAQTNFRAQDFQRCNTVGGKQVLKKQYMELLPPEMLFAFIILYLCMNKKQTIIGNYTLFLF